MFGGHMWFFWRLGRYLSVRPAEMDVLKGTSTKKSVSTLIMAMGGLFFFLGIFLPGPLMALGIPLFFLGVFIAIVEAVVDEYYDR